MLKKNNFLILNKNKYIYNLLYNNKNFLFYKINNFINQKNIKNIKFSYFLILLKLIKNNKNIKLNKYKNFLKISISPSHKIILFLKKIIIKKTTKNLLLININSAYIKKFLKIINKIKIYNPYTQTGFYLNSTIKKKKSSKTKTI